MFNKLKIIFLLLLIPNCSDPSDKTIEKASDFPIIMFYKDHLNKDKFPLMCKIDGKQNKISKVDSGVTKNHFIESEIVFPLKVVKNLKEKIATHLNKTKYLEGTCNPVIVKGWEKYPTEKCAYKINDKTGFKHGVVILLKISPKQMAKWIVYACNKTHKNKLEKCINAMERSMILDSGGQFPIAGAVYEDIYAGKTHASDGIVELYCFRNGVTVKIKGVQHRMTRQPGKDELFDCLNGKVIWVGNYARLMSTSIYDYMRYSHDTHFVNHHHTQKWLEVVKQVYQKSWNKYENALFIAWAKYNLNRL